MTHTELKAIVERCGGVEALAKLILVKPRRIVSWLYGERNIPPSMALLISLVMRDRVG